ncbi:hypothetical protein AAC387_Pa08g1159 [Persea americana]
MSWTILDGISFPGHLQKDVALDPLRNTSTSNSLFGGSDLQYSFHHRILKGRKGPCVLASLSEKGKYHSQRPATPLLDTINYPIHMKSLSIKELKQLANELRSDVIFNVSRIGGHHGSSLRVVELTVALHYVFNAPLDRILWDVGHQSYPHKILTGKRDTMPTMRQTNGLSGFTKHTESEYDCFGTGHNSTTISAGLGMAVGRDLKGRNNNVVDVIVTDMEKVQPSEVGQEIHVIQSIVGSTKALDLAMDDEVLICAKHGHMLDWLLGKGHVVLLRRAELKTFVDFHGNEAGKGGDLTHDETTIIAGALELTEKTAKDAMTPISKAFSLDLDGVFDVDISEMLT